MSEPIKKGQIAQAPTPQNTPASVTGSYLSKNISLPTIPSTIAEDDNLQKKLLSNPAIFSMIEGKLQTLVGADSGYIKNLPTKIKNRVYGLKTLQQSQFKLEAEFQADLLELEKKYHLKYAPILSKRKQIVGGELEPTAEEIEEGQALVEEDEDDEEDEDKEDKEDKDNEKDDEDDDDIKGIPQFWLTALSNLHPVSELINDRDTEVLDSLVNIKMEYLDTPGFKLIFEFDSNEFFSNSQLIKTYYYQKELGYSGDFIYDHAEGCDIKWLSNDSNVTVQVEKRKQRNKHTKQVRTIEKVTPIDSFFNFFNPPKAPNPDDDEEEDNDDDDDEDEDDEDGDLEQKLQLDYEIGELIKDKLIPRAVDWFTGDALQYEFGGEEDYDELEEDEDEFDEDDDDDDDRDDDDDDDDSDDDDEGANSAAAKTQPAECKQQ